MSKKQVKQIDPSLINFSFTPVQNKQQDRYIPKKDFKFERKNSEQKIVKFVRGDLVNVEEKKNLDYYIKKHDVKQKKLNFFPKKSKDLNIKFIKGEKYKITPVVKEPPLIKEQVNNSLIEVKKPINQFEGCILYKRDDEDLVPLKKEVINISVIKKEKISYQPEIYKKLYNKKGNDAINEINNTNETVYGDYFLQYICDINEKFDDVEWLNDNQYGLALKYLIKDDQDQQHALLTVLVKHLHKLNFPKIKDTYLVVLLFNKLLTNEIIEVDILLEWKESDEDCSGKLKALIQTSEWFLDLLEQLEEEEYED